MVNLFNLLPIGSMDGGRILGAVDRNFLLAGLGVGGYIAYAHTPMNPIFYLILLSSGYNTYQRFFGQSGTALCGLGLNEDPGIDCLSVLYHGCVLPKQVSTSCMLFPRS